MTIRVTISEAWGTSPPRYLVNDVEDLVHNAIAETKDEVSYVPRVRASRAAGTVTILFYDRPHNARARLIIDLIVPGKVKIALMINGQEGFTEHIQEVLGEVDIPDYEELAAVDELIRTSLDQLIIRSGWVGKPSTDWYDEE